MYNFQSRYTVHLANLLLEIELFRKKQKQKLH